MMPFAFDLISTFVMGSTLPVATTDRTIVPRSTVTTREASMEGVAPLRVVKPQMPATRMTTAAVKASSHLRDFFMLSSSGAGSAHNSHGLLKMTRKRPGKFHSGAV